MRFKGARTSLPSIARELSVDAIVEGSVKRSGEEVGISVQLIDANSDRHLWAHSYERNLQNVLALHREVAHAIATEIRPRISDGDLRTQSSVQSVDPVAYDHCVRGRFFWLQRTEKSLNLAMRHFEQALERDPTYAPAYSGLADSHFYLGYAFGRVPPVEAMPKARAAAEKAFSARPESRRGENFPGFRDLFLRLGLGGRGARASRGDPAESQLLASLITSMRSC